MVTTSGLISASDASVFWNALARLTMTLAASPAILSLNPNLYAMSRAWYPCSPSSGCSGSLITFSGVFFATSSISTPPSADAISVAVLRARSTVMPR